jgi:hypothetical protein
MYASFHKDEIFLPIMSAYPRHYLLKYLYQDRRVIGHVYVFLWLYILLHMRNVQLYIHRTLSYNLHIAQFFFSVLKDKNLLVKYNLTLTKL